MATITADEVVQDMQQLRALREALQTGAKIVKGFSVEVNFQSPPPGGVAGAIRGAVKQELHGMISLAQLKQAIGQNLNAQIAAIEAKYPGLTIET